MTIRLDDDVMALLNEMAHEAKITPEQLVSNLINLHAKSIAATSDGLIDCADIVPDQAIDRGQYILLSNDKQKIIDQLKERNKELESWVNSLLSTLNAATERLGELHEIIKKDRDRAERMDEQTKRLTGEINLVAGGVNNAISTINNFKKGQKVNSQNAVDRWEPCRQQYDELRAKGYSRAKARGIVLRDIHAAIEENPEKCLFETVPCRQTADAQLETKRNVK